jgi:amino acid transporter
LYFLFAGAGICFFAYPGFEDITFASEEIKNPGKSIPLAVSWCMALAMGVYMMFAAALTLCTPFSLIDPASAAPSALAAHGFYWPKYIISAGAMSGTLSALYGIMYISSRVAYSMAQDGLTFK